MSCVKRGREREVRTMDREGGKPVPEAWIGWDVMISAGTSGARVRGVLQEINDRGVVLWYGNEIGREPGHIFYPWSTVQAIILPEIEEQPS
jgi:hypothetical protein